MEGSRAREPLGFLFGVTLQLATQFPLKGVLGVKGVLGPRARAILRFFWRKIARARADPGPLSPQGPLSREIFFSSDLSLV